MNEDPTQLRPVLLQDGVSYHEKLFRRACKDEIVFLSGSNEMLQFLVEDDVLTLD